MSYEGFGVTIAGRYRLVPGANTLYVFVKYNVPGNPMKWIRQKKECVCQKNATMTLSSFFNHVFIATFSDNNLWEPYE
jgi:hypothetical protein